MIIVMKNLKHILFTLLIVGTFSLAAMAQSDDKKNPPPKDPPPKVVPKPKDEKPKNPPPDKDKPKKPSERK